MKNTRLHLHQPCLTSVLLVLFALAVASFPSKARGGGNFSSLNINDGAFTIDSYGNTYIGGNLWFWNLLSNTPVLEGLNSITLQSDSNGGINLNSYSNNSNPSQIALWADGADNSVAGTILLNATGTSGTGITLSSSGDITLSSSGYIYLSGTSLSAGLVGINGDGALVNATFSAVSFASLGLGSTTSPSYPLDVGGDARVSGNLWSYNLNSTGTATIQNLTTTGSATIGGGNFTLMSAASGANGANAETYSSTAGSLLNTYLTTDSATQYLDILANGGSGTGGIIRFLTKPTATTSAPMERMRIDPAGNVGIGTATPSSALQVAGATTIQTFSATSGSMSGTLYVTSTFSAHTGIRVAPGGDLSMGSFSYSAVGAP